MKCDNCGFARTLLRRALIIEPDGRKTKVSICTTCAAADLPADWTRLLEMGCDACDARVFVTHRRSYAGGGDDRVSVCCACNECEDPTICEEEA